METVIELIKAAIPTPDKIQGLRANDKTKSVSFQWNQTDFVVDKSLHAFELKGNVLYATPASILLSSLLRRARKERQLAEKAA